MLFFSPAWDEVVYWALDLETGGLDPKRDPILSVGMLPVRAGTIRLGEAYETLVRPRGGEAITAASVQAHQLVPDDVRDAPELGAVLREVDERLGDGVLLVHHAALDVNFLRRAYKLVGLHWRRPPVVDTVELLLREAKKVRFIDPDATGREPALNLGEARRRHGLPAYGAHDALTDAIAAAELFLVVRRRLNAKTLRELT